MAVPVGFQHVGLFLLGSFFRHPAGRDIHPTKVLTILLVFLCSSIWIVSCSDIDLLITLVLGIGYGVSFLWHAEFLAD